MRFCFSLLYIFFGFSAFSQQTLSAEQAKEDVVFLYDNMVKVHPGLYRYQDSTEYAEMFHAIRNSFVGHVDYLSFFNRISPLITSVKDLHTGYGHNKKWAKEHKKVLPFVLKEIDDEYHLQYNASSDTTFSRGLIIKEIEGQSIEEVTRIIRDNIGTDRNNEPAKRLYASKSIGAYYPRFFELADSVTVTATLPYTDSVLTFELATIERKALISSIIKRYPDKARKNLDYEILDSTKSVGKLDITSFVYKGSPLDIFQRKFGRTLKKRFKEIKRDSIEHLVLDLRSNGGGYIPNVGKVMKYLSQEPFKLIDTMAFKRSAYFKIFPVYRIIPPLMAPFYFNKTTEEYRYHANGKSPGRKPSKKHNYSGDLYVFMDANSYSATVFTIALLKDMERATFIGTIPGGATWGSHAGSWYTPKLPNSKIRLRIPQYRIVHSRWKKSHDDFFVQPDVEVINTAEDFKKDIDPYEKALFELIKD